MTLLDIACLSVGLIGFGLAVWFYVHLYRWARQCQQARVAISYKGKVKFNHPITDWLNWVSMLDADKDANGRIIYRMDKTAIAIIRRQSPPSRYQRWRMKRKPATEGKVG